LAKHYQEENSNKEFGRKLAGWQHQYLKKGIIYQGIWDIETTDFDPKRGFIVCYSFLFRNIVSGATKMESDFVTKDDIKESVKRNKFHFDYRLLQTLSDKMRLCDQVIGHFSTKFDMPFFRTRCLITKQKDLIPDYGEVLQGDTWRMAKNSLKLPRNTLNNLGYYTLGKSDKTYVDMNHWMNIWFHQNQNWNSSMKYIRDHCVIDVDMTYKALKTIERFNTVQRTFV
jgi:DNA polymerase elongation subunit (family B)